MENNEEMKNIIIDYLSLSWIYAKRFYENYKSRLSVESVRYSVSIHGIGMHVIDHIKQIELDFDYFHYDGCEIKYFDPWKLDLYSKQKYGISFSKSIIKELINIRVIEEYHNTGYYYLV